MQEEEPKKTIRAVGYVDPDDYQQFLGILTEEGLTFSSWLRRTIKRTVKGYRENAEAARLSDMWPIKDKE